MSEISFAKFDMVKFDGSENFDLWQRRVKDLLVQHEGVIRKATRRNERYGLEGSGSEDCDNDQTLFGWWRDVPCHGWGILGGNLVDIGKSVYV